MSLSLPVRSHTLILAALLGGLFLPFGQDTGPLWVVALTWFLVCLVTDALWHVSLDGHTSLTMAPAAHIATLALLPIGPAVVIIVVSSVCGALIWRRRGLGSALARGASNGAAAGVAAAVLLGAGAYLPWTTGAPSGALLDPSRLVGLSLAGVAYLLPNQIFSAMRGRTDRSVRWSEAWRGAFGYETELVTSAAMILVALLAVFCYGTLGYRGILLCAMPLLFVRDGSQRYVELESAQSKLVTNERLAAKGEMAAEIGHELNNYLAAVSGRAQLLLRRMTPGEEGSVGDEAERIRQLATRMSELAKGLMDFSHQGRKRSVFGVNELVEKTMEFVKPQPRFRSVTFSFDPASPLPDVEMDPGQIQQVLLTLFGRAAGNGGAGSESSVSIRTWEDPRRKRVGVEIRSGLRLVEGTGDSGGDPEIGTVDRILKRNQGRLERVNDPEDGETFRVLLPAA